MIKIFGITIKSEAEKMIDKIENENEMSKEQNESMKGDNEVSKKQQEIQYITEGGAFLRDTGLLFHINRTILHPLGLAMQVTIDDKTGECKISNKLWDYRDDPEGLLFDQAILANGLEKYMNFYDSFIKDKHEERKKVNGYIIQGGE